jgi:polysaccharide export outer membrane protein
VRTQRSIKSPKTSPRESRAVFGAAMVLSTFILAGCDTDSWFNPSTVGYWEHTPSTMPVLTRIDVVERQASAWQPSTPPTNDDLQPGELQYQLSAGDEIRVEVYELVTPQQTDVSVRTIDPSGNIRLPTIGEIPAAGLTISQLQRDIEDRVRAFVPDPIVSVILERGQGFSFVIYGAVENTGVYGINKPNFRLMEALALAGGTFSTTEKIYVIRSAALDPSVEDPNKDRGLGRPTGTNPNAGPTGTKPPDIDEIINRLNEPPKPSTPPTNPPSNPAPTNPPTEPPVTPPNPEPAPRPAEPEKASMGALGPSAPTQDSTAKPTTPPDTKPPIDVDELSKPADAPKPAARTDTEEGWVWDSTKQAWVKSPNAPVGAGAGIATAPPAQPAEPRMYATRSIEVDYQKLAHGESNLNIVIRPGDRIYVDPPLTGVVYIGGEISRPGVYELPRLGGKLTLSRLVSAAGGLSPIAIPQRVDLVRVVGPGREAALRVDLAAIDNRQEPDIYLKPDDHIIIGTNFFAVPLAAIRNGFRMTYGFGFLIDRNFGNDVFGAPPVNVVGE